MRYRMIMLVVLAGCSNKPSAIEVCGKLEAAGVATKCRVSEPGGIGAAATERVEFDLPHGKTGQVLRFGDAAGYDATVKAFDAAAMLAGPHRYGKPGALVFVQLNSETAADVGAKAKTVVEGL